jgi:hypothetical protein
LAGYHVLAAERLYGDDTMVPILAKGKTVTGHIWTYVRDDRPFGTAPPAALYYASRDRRQEHPDRHLTGFAGILHHAAVVQISGESYRLKDKRRAGIMARPAKVEEKVN